LQTLGDHLRKRRLDLNLLQKEVAKELSTGESTITNWEKNRTFPSLPFLPKIIDFLGYGPMEILPENPGERIAFYRKILGLSQKKLAQALRIDPSTLGRWEKFKSRPSQHLWEKLITFLNAHLSFYGGFEK
jgi:transcriptional regulator with XRE-family HTH domain